MNIIRSIEFLVLEEEEEVEEEEEERHAAPREIPSASEWTKRPITVLYDEFDILPSPAAPPPLLSNNPLSSQSPILSAGDPSLDLGGEFKGVPEAESASSSDCGPLYNEALL